MPVWGWILIAVGVVVVALVLVAAWSRKRTEDLKAQFGPEYDRTIEGADSRREAEAELRERQDRRSQLEIRPLSSGSRERYAQEWSRLQSRFVDEPDGSFDEADRLVSMVMAERGYPMEDFDQRVADVSVDHPDVVEHYRAAHGVALANQGGRSNTEQLRQGMVHYRALFEELLAPEPRQAVR